MKKLIYIMGLLFLNGVMVFSQNKKHILLMNGMAHIGNGQVIESSYIAINNGKLEMVAPMKGIRLNASAYDTVIDLAGKHVYPAII
ncbi:MAG: amidohydrolase family protein, partial [Bacteroidia bacterium]